MVATQFLVSHHASVIFLPTLISDNQPFSFRNRFEEIVDVSTIARLTGADFDSMVERGAFDKIGPMKIELIHGELRFMNPAGPIHDDYIRYLTDWSYENSNRHFCSIQVQCSFMCDDNRPEPDLAWLLPKRYGRLRATSCCSLKSRTVRCRPIY